MSFEHATVLAAALVLVLFCYAKYQFYEGAAHGLEEGRKICKRFHGGA